MRSNATGPDPLQRRLGAIASNAVGTQAFTAPDADAVALRSEARERLRAGDPGLRQVKMRDGDAAAKERASRTWPLWVVFDILLLLLIVPLVVAVPPLLDCRQKHDENALFVGETFERCARHGIAERWNALDSRLKMFVRGSG
ncbi:hypothetical protein ASG40_06175 [Methylobacterium sp. Leaf399]|uniref:hypothetical protein n=1 Tax=unclassified Methylobacterium TaxID=2615210 RepID=UPI0006F673A9|nr:MULTISPECIES: hypothetical protein [unclassified Methylobacterium]KQT14878.1 hypothetical protein ASG40_06175 [Methylobacterium sp. Leaf399]KQT90543.1 hypothetical protein ASG59_01795 [Methylobacterium sp. Leaf466]